LRYPRRSSMHAPGLQTPQLQCDCRRESNHDKSLGQGSSARVLAGARIFRGEEYVVVTHTTLVSDCVRFATLASAVAVALGVAESTYAQQSEVEEVVVTGSRIARRDFEASSPITTVEAERFEESSTIAIESVVNQLPQFVPAASQFE